MKRVTQAKQPITVKGELFSKALHNRFNVARVKQFQFLEKNQIVAANIKPRMSRSKKTTYEFNYVAG